METYRIKTTIAKDGTIFIQNLPFMAGDKVEILVQSRKYSKDNLREKYPLRGLPVNYAKPFKSVAENDWAILG